MSRDHDAPAVTSGLSRRQFTGILAAGGAVALAGCSSVDFTGESGTQPDQGDTGDGPEEPSEPPTKAMPIDEALTCDTDMTKSFDAEMRLADDPVVNHKQSGQSNKKSKGTGPRQGIVHVTSDGDPTQDYPCLSIDLRAQELTLGDIATGRPLSYDYLAGDAHEPAAPGQVFLTLRTAAKEKDSKNERIWVAYRTLNEDQSTRWRRRTVSRELSRGGWRALEVDPELVDIDGERVRKGITSTVIENEIGTLRSQEPFQNLRQRFGDDADLLAVTVGTGSVEESVVLDTYFHTLSIGETRRPLPAMLTMALSVEQSADPIELRLQFANEEHGLAFADDTVHEESIHLSPYTSIARPIDGTDAWQAAVQATDVDVVSETELVARFPGHLDDFGEAPMVWGALAHQTEQPVTFLGVRDSRWND